MGAVPAVIDGRVAGRSIRSGHRPVLRRPSAGRRKLAAVYARRTTRTSQRFLIFYYRTVCVHAGIILSYFSLLFGRVCVHPVIFFILRVPFNTYNGYAFVPGLLRVTCFKRT